MVPGIQAIATVGHSPGHHSFLIESRGQQLLLPCDVLAHHVINLRHPDWPIVPDQIPEGIEARKRLLARATHEQIPILACHFPFPGLGRVTRFGDAYQYVPTS